MSRTSTTSPSSTNTTTELVLKDGTQIVVRRADPAELAEFLTGENLIREVDPTTAVQEIVQTILAGQTADEIIGAGSVTHAKDMLGVPFRFLDVKWMHSSFVNDENPNAFPYFGVFDIVSDAGEKRTMTTGALGVMATAYALWKRGVLSDRRVQILGKETNKGFTVLNVAFA